MGIDAPDGRNDFWYRIGWNLDAAFVPASWSSTVTVEGIGEKTAGGGAALGYIDDNEILDLLLMGIDAPDGENEFRYKIGWNLGANGVAQSWSTTKRIPAVSHYNAGGDVALAYLNDNGRPDLILMGIDGADGVNDFRYKIGWDLGTDGATVNWSGMVAVGGIGTSTDGGGVAVAYVDDNNAPDLILMGIDNPSGANQFRYRVGLDLGINTGQTANWSGIKSVTDFALGNESRGGGAEVIAAPLARARLASPQAGSNGLVNVPVGEDVSFVVGLEAGDPGTIVEAQWKIVTGTGRTTAPYSWSTSGPEKNLRFADPGEYTVRCRAIVLIEGRHVALAPLAFRVRAWNRPAVAEAPPQERIDAGDVSWFGGKYAGVAGQPVRLMATGTTATSGTGEQIAKFLWDLDGDWSTVEVEQPASEVASHTFAAANASAQLRCKAVTNYGISSHAAAETGRTFALTVYDAPSVDPRTDPGDRYSGRVNAAVKLKGELVQRYQNATVEYQWRVNSRVPEPALWNGAVHAGDYVELTPAQPGRSGQLEYSDVALSDDWSVTGEFWSGGGTGADAFYVYVWADATPTSEAWPSGGYTVAFDEYNDQIQLFLNGSLLHTVAQTIPLDNSQWRPFRIVFERGRFRVYLDYQLRLEYDAGDAYQALLDDATANTGNDLYGVGARTGAQHNIHRVRDVAWTAGTPVATNAHAEAEYTWSAEGVQRVGLTARVTTDSGVILEGTEWADVDVEAGRPTAMPGGPYRGGLAGGDHSPIQFEGNHPDFVEADDVGKIEEWVWFFSDAANGALLLDGQDDRVVVGPLADFPSDSVTVAFWMKTSDKARAGTPLSYAVADSDDELGIYRYTGLDLRVSGVQSSPTELAVNDGQWHHLAMTWSSADGVLVLYVDGAEAHRDTVAAGDPIQSGGYLVIGQDQDALEGGYDPGQAFQGLLDEVAVWRMVRTSAQIRSDMQGGLTGTEQNLVLLLQFERSAADDDTAAVDATGQHPGRLVNTAAEAWVADGRPAVVRGVWNPTHSYPVAGERQAALKVRAQSGKWSSVSTAQVQVVEGTIAGRVRAADQRTPVADVRAYLSSSHVTREALVRVAAADTAVNTTADGELWVLTDQNGYFEYRHLPLGTYRVRVAKGEGDRAHEFEPSVRATELTLNGPNQLATDFVDLSVFPVGGRIAYSLPKNGQTVYEPDVIVTAQPLGSTSAIEALPSSKSLAATGTNYTIPLFTGQYLMLAKKEGRDIRVAASTPEYDPSTGVLTVRGARTDVDFVDGTTFVLTVRVEDSGEYGLDSVRVEVSGDNGQADGLTDSEGEVQFTLNPGQYSVAVEGAMPKGERGEQPAAVDLNTGDQRVTMVVPSPIVLAFVVREGETTYKPRLFDVDEDFLAQFGLTAQDNPAGYMYFYPPEPRRHTYTIRATSNGHPVEGYTLFVRDNVSMATDEEAEEGALEAIADTVDYTIAGGLPRQTDDEPPLAAPKIVAFRAEKDGYKDSETLRDSVIVLGEVAVGSAAQVVAIPDVNYTVLHDPPGDHSYSYLDDNMTLSGIIADMQIQWNGVHPYIPVYPSSWIGVHASREIAGVDEEADDLGSAGLLDREYPESMTKAFVVGSAYELVSGGAIVLKGALGWVFRLAKIGLEIGHLASGETVLGMGHFVQYDISANTRIQTPAEDALPDVLGPGKGDVYYGEGWALALQTKYFLGIRLRVDQNGDPILDEYGAKQWDLDTEQAETYNIIRRHNQYLYTVRDIEGIIASLQRVIDSENSSENEKRSARSSRDRWQTLLNDNLAYVWQRDYVAQGKTYDDFKKDHRGFGINDLSEGYEMLVVSGGASFAYSRTIAEGDFTTYAKVITVESSSSISNETEISTGFKVFGQGVTISFKTGSTLSLGTSQSLTSDFKEGTGVEQSVGFVLADDDVGDNVITYVHPDRRWGTPIFFQEPGGVTSDPWEPGTNKGVDVTMELIEEPVGPFDYQDGAHYKLKLRYTGLRELLSRRVDFDLQALPSTNPDQAFVTFNDYWPPYTVGLEPELKTALIDVCVSPPERDLGNSHDQQYAVQIRVEEQDDQQIHRVLTLNPTFADLRAPRATLVAPYDGQRISPVFFPAGDPFRIVALSEDLDIARMQLEIRTKMPDGVWEPWRLLAGMDWQAGQPNPAVTVVDRLDRRPVRRQFTFAWPEDQIRALGVGEYAMRAVATDSATVPNRDLDAPAVVFLVDEAKPSVLSTVPDFQARDKERLYRGELSVTFTDDMRPTDFDDRTFRVADLLAGGTKVPGYVSYSPALRKVVFVPVVPFQPNSLYRAEIATDIDQDGDGQVDSPGAHDLAGNPLDNALSWTFRTTEAPFEPTWDIVFRVEDGSGVDGNNIAAVEYGAADGEDTKDARAVPGLAGQLRLSFIDRQQREFDRDIRPADGRLAHHWFFVIDNAAADSTVKLWWTPSLRLTKTTRDYQVIRLVEFGADGRVTNTVTLDPTEAQVDPETGLIPPVLAYSYVSGGETSRYFRLDVQRIGAVYGTLAAGTSGWQFFSVPITPQRSEPFVNLGDDIDPFTLYQYEAGIGGFRVYPLDLGLVALTAGRGFFTRLEADAQVDVGGAANHDDVRVELAAAGWHAIGNPFVASVPVAALRVAEQPFAAAAAAGLVEPVLYRWNVVPAADVYLSDVPRADGYVAVTAIDSLVPWEGYWLRTRQPGLALDIPAPAGVALATLPEPAYLQPPMARPVAAAGTEPAPGEFTLTLSLHTPTVADATTALGTRAGASSGWDPYDRAEPPALTGAASAFFRHADWGPDAGNYNADYRDLLRVGAPVTWEVTALVEGAADQARLSWAHSIDAVPADVVLSFRPAPAGETTDGSPVWQDMRSVQGVELGTTPRLAQARYQIRAERLALAAPGQLQAEGQEEAIRLSWTPNPDPQVSGYIIRRHPGTAAEWDSGACAVIELAQAADEPVAEYVDRDVAPGVAVTYQVATRFRTGAEAAGDLITATALHGVRQTALLQSFPNPANPELWIPYELAEEATVRIEVFNAAGQLVRTLDVGRQPRGRYVGEAAAARWDGCDQAGVPVSSGVYVYRLTAGDYAATRRAVLLR